MQNMTHYEHPRVEGCSDGGCILKRPVGMHTNGGCRCISTQMTKIQTIHTKATIDYLRKLLNEKDTEIEELKKQLGK